MERVNLGRLLSLKTLMVGNGGSSAGSYLADPTFTIPYHRAVIILFKSVPVHQLPWLALYELRWVRYAPLSVQKSGLQSRFDCTVHFVENPPSSRSTHICCPLSYVGHLHAAFTRMSLELWIYVQYIRAEFLKQS